MERIKRLAMTAVVAAGVLVVAAIANASSPYSSDPESGVSDDFVVAESPLPSEELSPTAGGEEQEDQEGTDSDGGAEAEHPENHGKYVSQVAHCAPKGPMHGRMVSEMARTHENEAEKAEELCRRAEEGVSPEPSPTPDTPEGTEDEVTDEGEEYAQKPVKSGEDREGKGENSGKPGSRKGSKAKNSRK